MSGLLFQAAFSLYLKLLNDKKKLALIFIDRSLPPFPKSDVKRNFISAQADCHSHLCFASHHCIFTAKYCTELTGSSLANTLLLEIKQSLMVLAKCSIIYGVHVGEKISCQKKVSSGHITFAVLFLCQDNGIWTKVGPSCL